MKNRDFKQIINLIKKNLDKFEQTSYWLESFEFKYKKIAIHEKIGIIYNNKLIDTTKRQNKKIRKIIKSILKLSEQKRREEKEREEKELVKKLIKELE